jgi:hypothetical protein
MIDIYGTFRRAMNGLSRILRARKSADEWSDWRYAHFDEEIDDQMDRWSVMTGEEASCASLHGMIEKIRNFYQHVFRRRTSVGGVDDLADAFSTRMSMSGADGAVVRFDEEGEGDEGTCRLRRANGV